MNSTETASTFELSNALIYALPSLRARVEKNVSPQVRSRICVDEVLQDACLRALQDADKFEYRGEAEFHAWLYKIATHLLLAKIKRGARQDNCPDPSSGRDKIVELVVDQYLLTASQQFARKEAVMCLKQAFRQLSAEHRTVLNLRYDEAKDFNEISAVMGRAPGACRGLHRNALSALKTAMNNVGVYLSGQYAVNA